jgi:hypothetical protein
VKETFDLRRQVDQHPWLMVGGSAVLGYLAGSLLPRGEERQSESRYASWSSAPRNGGVAGHYAASTETAAPAVASYQTGAAGTSRLGELGNLFGDEISKLKGLAIGTLMGLVRDALASSVPPSLSPQLTEVVNNFTTKMGGQPISGPVLQETGLDRWFQREETPREHGPSRPTEPARY